MAASENYTHKVPWYIHHDVCDGEVAVRKDHVVNEVVCEVFSGERRGKWAAGGTVNSGTRGRIDDLETRTSPRGVEE